MTKDDLKEKIRKLLDISASESDVAFELMIKKVSALIKPEEALKIPDLGVFMLKKEPLPREERANLGVTSKNSLIFSPVSEGFTSDSDSVFLSFDLDEIEKDNFEFSESIFSVSVGKPIVTPTGVKNFSDSEGDGAMQTTLEEKVTQLVTNSERATDFNLWDNYLSSVGEENVEEDLKELISQNVGEHHPEDEKEEPLEEANGEEEAVEREAENIDDEAEPENKEGEESEEEIKWDWGEELKEELGAEDEPPVSSDENEVPPEEENKEIDDETSELFEPMEEEIGEEETEENPEVEQAEENAEPDETPESEEEPEEEEPEREEELDDDFDNARETIEYSPDDLPPEPEEKKKKKGFALPKFGKMFWILLGAFLVIGIAGAYFLFFTGEEKPEEKTAVEKQEEIPPEEYRKRLKPEESVISSEDLAAQENAHNAAGDEQTDETIRGETETSPHKSGEEKPKSEETKKGEKPVEHKPAETERKPASSKSKEKVTEEPKQKEEKTVQQNNSLYRKFPGEKQISNLIFKHGGNYSVQISSWRDPQKAESEAKRLRNMGYDAFIVEKYLSALRSNWYLVRIGFFNSPEEAKRFRTKNKF